MNTNRALSKTIILGFLFLLCFAKAHGQDPTLPKHHKALSEYSDLHDGKALLIMIEGKVVFESYANKLGETLGHPLASGTKSFTGVLAACAAKDGLLTLDEKVSDTIIEWKEDKLKAEITIRQLLSLTSGIDPGKSGKGVPSYKESIQSTMKDMPGKRFRYGPAPFQIFGELLHRKLKDESVNDYLKKRILDPIGMKPTFWRKDKDKNPHLPSGATFNAKEWAKFGELVRLKGVWQGEELLDPDVLDACFEPSGANPRYGVSFWLGNKKIKHIPEDIVYAAGKGHQRLYISRKHKLVVVRQSPVFSTAPFNDEEFLSLLFTGEKRTVEKKVSENIKRRAKSFLRLYDKNGNNELSKDELTENFASLLLQFDFDNNGELSEEELVRILSLRRINGDPSKRFAGRLTPI
ncbi:MAG: serine hydrolase [Pirellulaceae bacterium]|nr:serine hydrolase [Pirellulaceae bacterium]